MKKRIPLLLILLRLCIGLLLLPLSLASVKHYASIAAILLIIGLLTDIFDGIIARKLGVSGQRLRRLDSSVDQIFFILVAIATYIQCPQFFRTHAAELLILLGAEALTYIFSFARFGKEVATHSIGAKVWTLFLVATLMQIMLQCRSGILFDLMFWIGLLTRAEIIAIILILKKWANDVPTVYHALLLRKNRKIKRHSLFNG